MNILFVFPEIDQLGPRSIRINNITSFLKKNNNIVFIAKTLLNEMGKANDNEFIIPNGLLFSKIFRFKIAKYLLYKILFPDLYILNYKTTKRKLISVVKDHNIDTVVFVKPFSLYFISKTLKRLFPKINIVFDIGDPLYNNAANFTKNPFKYLVENKVLKYSDKIIVTNKNTKEYYQKVFNFPSSKINVISQGVNLDLIPTQNNNERILKGKITLLYAGLFYKRLRNPLPFFDTIEEFENDEFHLYCIGTNKEYIDDGYRNITFYPRMGQHKLVQMLNQIDVLLFIDNSFGIQTPGKIYELLAFKKIIFCIYENDRSEIIQFLKKFGNTIFVKNTKEEIYNGLRKLYHFNPKFDYNIKDFSWEKRAEDYENILRKLHYTV